MNANQEHFLFVEKYRPKTVEECILPATIKQQLKDFLQKGEIPHCIFAGQQGSGKTTCAYAISNELGADVLYINASNETGIDTIRTKVVQFASTVSFDNNIKVVILDEAERISGAGADALKAIVEQFSKNTRFILTTNNRHRLSAPIQSRMNVYDFVFESTEKQKAAISMLKRTEEILKAEEIEYDKKAVAALVAKYFPDFRKTLNEIQRFSANGKIDAGILVERGTTFDELITSMKSKKFGEVRKWTARNCDVDPQMVFRHFFDNATNLFEGASIPEVILLTSQYQLQSAQVIDQEINTTAFLVEVMSGANWK